MLQQLVEGYSKLHYNLCTLFEAIFQRPLKHKKARQGRSFFDENGSQAEKQEEIMEINLCSTSTLCKWVRRCGHSCSLPGVGLMCSVPAKGGASGWGTKDTFDKGICSRRLGLMLLTARVESVLLFWGEAAGFLSGAPGKGLQECHHRI